MGRGGLGARKALAEKIERSTKYRLVGLQRGSRVAECLDRYRRWELGHRLGTIVRSSIDAVHVVWDGDEEPTYYTQGDARYKVDTNLWRITPPKNPNVLDMLRSTPPSGPVEPWPEERRRRAKALAEPPMQEQTGADTLTSPREGHSIAPSPQAGEPRPRKGAEMATGRTRKKPTKPVEPEPVEELEEELVDDVEPEDDDLVESEDDDQAGDIPDTGEDLEEDDDVVEPEPEPTPKKRSRKAKKEPEPEADDEEEPEVDASDRDTYTAKQVATKLGTDAKTIRKFFRSDASTVEPVGQGGRYEFAAEDLPQIAKEFKAWQAGNAERKPVKGGTKKSRSRTTTDTPVIEEDEVEELEELEEEPSDEDLANLDEELEDLDDEELED